MSPTDEQLGRYRILEAIVAAHHHLKSLAVFQPPDTVSRLQSLRTPIAGIPHKYSTH